MGFMNQRGFDIVSVNVGDCAGLDLLEQVHGAVDDYWCLAERFEKVAALICGVGCDVDAKGDAVSQASGMEMTGSKDMDGPIEVYETESGRGRCCMTQPCRFCWFGDCEENWDIHDRVIDATLETERIDHGWHFG
jgi:hypothetical protein